jgi:hypothetical protein
VENVPKSWIADKLLDTLDRVAIEQFKLFNHHATGNILNVTFDGDIVTFERWAR